MPTLPEIFLFDPEKPLLFTRLYFWVFYAVVLILYSIIYRQRAARNAFLFAASLFFYWKTSGLFFMLLVFSTVSDYYLGNLIHYSGKQAWRKFGVVMSVFINLFMLSYFKYTYLFVDTVNHLFSTDIQVVNHLALASNRLTGTHFDVTKILLPVGISFYTFQTISYTVDLYRRKINP